MKIRCPHCHSPIEVLDDSDYKDIECDSCGSNFNLIGGESTEEYKPDRRKLGQFTLHDRVGLGAFGSVFKAHDETLDRTVAVKIPRNEQLIPEDREKFLREARAAAQLQHPNIVSVHEVGRQDDSIYIVSDFVDGVSLQSYLTANQFSVTEAAELVEKLARAVHYAHEQGVIHRDLKPGNVMLDETGQPHVMDFGLAKREAGEVTMTMEGARLGTPAYMPPEQIDKAHDADARSDIYSLGVILYELLTGELPFRGDQAMLLHQVRSAEAPSPRKLSSHVNRDLETITSKCLQKQPDHRYPAAAELADDLRRFLDGDPIVARPVSMPVRAMRLLMKQAVVVRATFATVLTAGVIAAVVFALTSVGIQGASVTTSMLGNFSISEISVPGVAIVAVGFFACFFTGQLLTHFFGIMRLFQCLLGVAGAFTAIACVSAFMTLPGELSAGAFIMVPLMVFGFVSVIFLLPFGSIALLGGFTALLFSHTAKARPVHRPERLPASQIHPMSLPADQIHPFSMPSEEVRTEVLPPSLPISNGLQMNTPPFGTIPSSDHVPTGPVLPVSLPADQIQPTNLRSEEVRSEVVPTSLPDSNLHHLDIPPLSTFSSVRHSPSNLMRVFRALRKPAFKHQFVRLTVVVLAAGLIAIVAFALGRVTRS